MPHQLKEGLRVKLLRITKHMSPSVPNQATSIVPGGEKKKKVKMIFLLKRNNWNFPPTDGEEQIVAQIVELLKYSGDQLEREVWSFLN